MANEQGAACPGHLYVKCDGAALAELVRKMPSMEGDTGLHYVPPSWGSHASASKSSGSREDVTVGLELLRQQTALPPAPPNDDNERDNAMVSRA